jgi:NAD(P)-dependent dehydrogenase (short-subunit alcohol dehydrogenase family)
MELQGTRGLLTGAAGGLGSEMARDLARRGVTLVLSGRDEAALEELRNSLPGNGHSVFVADLSDRSVATNLIGEVEAKAGPLDLLVNNAGIEIHGDVLQTSFEQWQQTFAVNSNAVFLVSKAALPTLLATGEAAIVNIASDAGLIGEPGLDAYVASKHAVVGLTKCMALAWGAKGLRVNVVCPGMAKTPLTALKSQELIDAYEALVPMRRLGEPEEIARSVEFLLSPAASYINGVSLVVDGGGMAGNYFSDENIRD